MSHHTTSAPDDGERERQSLEHWLLTPVSRLIAQKEFTAFLNALQREYNEDRASKKMPMKHRSEYTISISPPLIGHVTARDKNFIAQRIDPQTPYFKTIRLTL
jgi:hypothetical protein